MLPAPGAGSSWCNTALLQFWVLRVVGQGFCANPCRPPQQPTGAEASARAGLLGALAALVPPVSAAAPAGGPGAAAAGAAALPEDWGLRTFGPLAKAHAALEFSQPVSRAVRLWTGVSDVV